VLADAIQEPVEFQEWLDRLAQIRPRHGLEIGTFKGGSACLTLEALPKIKRLVTVDIQDRSKDLLEAAASYHRRITFVQGDSHMVSTRDAVVRALGRKPLDFLFIDGHHSYESVSSDFYLYAPLVRPGGLVALHDIQSVKLGYEHTAGVERFWQELSARESEHCQSINRCFGIGIYRR
jgi:predicted O-methyltransferase YrrM